jgi:6,7-dimethyl-8-ribityllumazine synthase
MGEIRLLEGLRIPPVEAGFGIVASRFNKYIVDALVSGCTDVLRRHGVAGERQTLVWVPGAWELPVAARALAAREDIHAVIALGAVIRGATAHFDYVASACAQGLAAVGAQCGKPVIFGVLTVDTIEQAIERAGTKDGNKGADAALAAIEMVSLMQQLELGA